jgi:Fuc2NAc and GlcNAc transferase
MTILLLPLAFLSSYVLAKLFYHYAARLGFIAHSNHRSSHEQPICTAGGVSFVVTFLFFSYFFSLDTRWWLTILLASSLLFFVSLIDDRKSISALWRFSCQLIAVVLLYYCASDYFNVNSIFFSLFFIFASVWFINLFNFMDGINTLAALQAMVVMLCAALELYCFYPSNDLIPVFLLATAAVAGFLPWNVTPAKLFMGDVGSVTLAFILMSLALLSIVQSTLTLYSWCILMTMFWLDATMTLLKRIWRGEKWYEAHRSHFYQIQARKIGSHIKVSLVYMLINIVWLLPISFLSLRYPQYGLYCTLIAVLPIAGVFMIKGE